MPGHVLNPDLNRMKRVHSFEIEIEYLHNLKELYKRLHFWLEDQGWKDIHGSIEYEVRYWQRDLPGDRQEHHIWWRAWKDSTTPFTSNSFFRYFLKINFQTINSRKGETMHQGKKWKLDQTNTVMRVKGYLITEYQDGWDAGLLKSLKDRFERWIYKDKIKEEEERALNKTIEFQNHIKEFLEIAMDRDLPPNMYPPNMLPR